MTSFRKGVYIVLCTEQGFIQDSLVGGEPRFPRKLWKFACSEAASGPPKCWKQLINYQINFWGGGGGLRNPTLCTKPCRILARNIEWQENMQLCKWKIQSIEAHMVYLFTLEEHLYHIAGYFLRGCKGYQS